MIKLSQILPAALITLALASCGGRYRTEEGLPPADATGYATVKVENENISDMRVYVRPATTGSRFRLGIATGMETTTLKIPRSFVTGVTQLVFEISPTSGGGSQFSQTITIGPGDEIVLRIPAR